MTKLYMILEISFMFEYISSALSMLTNFSHVHLFAILWTI